MTETEVVRDCKDLLQLLGIHVMRINCGSVKIGRRFVRFTDQKGVSDLIGILPDGKFLAVECKKGRNKPTLEQARFLGWVREAGGVALVAHSADELEHDLDQLGYGFAALPLEAMDGGSQEQSLDEQR